MQGKLNVGINGVYSIYDIPKKIDVRNYNQFDFKGTQNYVLGLYANYYIKKALFFTEIASSKSGGKAISAGVIASLSSLVQASLHYRNYSTDFHSFYGTAFGENTRISNEKGIYREIKIMPAKGLSLTSYLDLFSFPWLKYRVDKPSRGNDFMLAAIHEFNSNFRFQLQFRLKTKELNFVEETSSLVQVLPKTTNRLLFDFDCTLSKQFLLQTRFQQSFV